MLPWTQTPFRMRFRMLSSVTVLSLALAMGGCASVGSPPHSTLSGAEQLTTQPDGTRAWRAAQLQVTAFYLPADALEMGTQVKLDEVQQAMLRKAFAQALVKELQEAGLRSADAAGPGVVTVRGTLTAVELASPGLNALTTVLLFAPLSRGGVSMDIEARESGAGGARVAALSFKGQAGANNISSAFSGLGHAELQTELAARKFADLLLQRAPQSAR